MEMYRACFAFLVVCCLLTSSFLTEALGARHTPEYSAEFSRTPLSHQRTLSAVYHVEACRWMQESSCQINPEYARHLLNNPEDGIIQDALLDEAACMSMTHEAACISQHSCGWVEKYSVNRDDTGNVCQFSGIPDVLNSCTYPSLRRFVMGYKRCHKQLGGTCPAEEDCEHVKISMHNEGCGLNGRKVLDLIIGTPASQSELVAQLVESSSKLRKWYLPVLRILESKEGDGARRLLQDGDSDTTLTVEDDTLSGRGNSNTEKSQITGTGSEGEPDSTDLEVSNVSTKQRKKQKKGVSDEGKKDSDSENTPPVIGSLSFNISHHLTSKKAGMGSTEDKEEPSLESLIQTPLVLEGPVDHLENVNISIPVRLRNVIDILNAVTDVMEDQVRGDEDTDGAIAFAAQELEIMRFRLDNQLDAPSNVWNGSDMIWWMLQSSIQSIAISNVPLNETIDSNAPKLSTVIQLARETWKRKKLSKHRQQLAAIEKRLEALMGLANPEAAKRGSSRKGIESLNRLMEIVVEVFNETLQETYPQVLTTEFAERHNQTWVKLAIQRNKKWRAIQRLISRDGKLGNSIIGLVQGLFRVHSPQATTATVPYLRTLESVVNELVGSAVATDANRYRISNLPEHLESLGLTVWQQGPHMTVEKYATQYQRAVSNLELSTYVKLERFLPVSDSVVNLLKAVIRLIDAKSVRNTTSLPEETTVLLALEAALNVITDWNNFAWANKLTGAIRDEHPFGHKDITDFILSLVGCLTLGNDGDGCRDMDRSQCDVRGLKRWDSATGRFSETSNHTICAPDNITYRFSDMFPDISSLASAPLMTQITDLYFISAYCPSLIPEMCRTDERCEVYVIADQYLGCRSSSNFTNYVVEAHQIAGLAATSDSCRLYLGLPVCGNLMTDRFCTITPTCVWTAAHRGPNNTSQHVCMTDWVEQLNFTEPHLLRNSQLIYSVEECRNHVLEKDCRVKTLEASENRAHETQLPRTKAVIPRWLAYTLSVAVAVAVACGLYLMYRAFRPPPRAGAGKKGKGKKKGDPLPPQRTVELPFFEHALRAQSNSPSQRRDDFDFVKEAIETEPSFATTSSRFSTNAESRMETNRSGTITEISEIQAVSEELESSSDSDIDGDDGWTTYSEDITEDEDASLPELPT